MPESDPTVRRSAISHICKAGVPARILDIGVGSGFYGRALKGLRQDAIIFGIEIWEKYLTAHSMYEKIFIGDMRTFNYSMLDVDLVIAADVLEHVDREECIGLLDLLKDRYPWIIVTIPIVDCPQGPYQGNVYEAHLYQWRAAEFAEANGFTLIEDCGTCGLFEYRKQ
jgi:hypothetical protein